MTSSCVPPYVLKDMLQGEIEETGQILFGMIFTAAPVSGINRHSLLLIYSATNFELLTVYEIVDDVMSFINFNALNSLGTTMKIPFRSADFPEITFLTTLPTFRIKRLASFMTNFHSRIAALITKNSVIVVEIVLINCILGSMHSLT